MATRVKQRTARCMGRNAAALLFASFATTIPAQAEVESVAPIDDGAFGYSGIPALFRLARHPRTWPVIRDTTSSGISPTYTLISEAFPINMAMQTWVTGTASFLILEQAGFLIWDQSSAYPSHRPAQLPS